MSDPMVANPGAKSSLGDIVGDSGSEARLAQIAGVMGMGEGGRRFKSSKQEAVIRHLRRALKMLAVGESPVPQDIPAPELASWTMLCNALMSSDRVIVKD